MYWSQTSWPSVRMSRPGHDLPLKSHAAPRAVTFKDKV